MFQHCINKCQPNHKAELMAPVFWYSAFPTHPSHHTKMYQVMQEVDMHGCQKAGIINLKSICPLAPVFDETCKPHLISVQCFDTIHMYHFNPYSSHSFFHCFRS